MNYGTVSSRNVTAVTQLISGPGEGPAPPGQEATLLAVVPIPGTGTSLAIVGYVIPALAEPNDRDPAKQPRPEPDQGPGLVLDHERRRAWAGGEEIALTFQEFELLAFLSAHPAVVFSRADLVDRVWAAGPARDSRTAGTDSRTVDVHVSRLRRKLGPVYSRCVITEYRVGYQFRPPIVTKGLSASKQEYPVWQTGYTSKACSGVGETPNRR